MRELPTDFHFSKSGAARYLGRSVRWLDYQLNGANPPPGFKVGKGWLFRKSELDAWLEQFRTESDIDTIVNDVMNELKKSK